MKKIICIFLSVFIILTLSAVNVNADDKHPEVGGEYYKDYDLQCSRNGSSNNPNNLVCWRLERNTTKEYYIYQEPVLFSQNLNGTIRTAVIPAANYDKTWDKVNFPETFTIEGAMSEDISVCF